LGVCRFIRRPVANVPAPIASEYQIRVWNGLTQGDDFRKITRGADGSYQCMMCLRGKRSSSRYFFFGMMGDPETPSDLIGEHLDPQAGDKTSQHRAGQKVGKKRQPKKPEHKKQQPR